MFTCSESQRKRPYMNCRLKEFRWRKCILAWGEIALFSLQASPVLLLIPVLRSGCQHCLSVLAINSSPWIYYSVQLENIFVGIVLLCSTLLLTHSLEENDGKNLEIGVFLCFLFVCLFLRDQPVYWIADHKEVRAVQDLCQTFHVSHSTWHEQPRASVTMQMA